MNFSGEPSWWMIMIAALCCFIAGVIFTLSILSLAFPSKISKREARDLHYPTSIFKIIFIILFLSCFKSNVIAADSTPPVISSFNVRKAIITDFPVHVTFAYSNYNGPCYDSSTGITVNKAFYLSWPITSNWIYTVWFSSSLTTNLTWIEWGVSSNVHPARVNGVASTYVPIYPLSNRFYQIRANQSVGITYP